MKEINLILTINEVNMIIKVVGQFPYNQVAELVTKIHVQASSQIQDAEGELSDNLENQNPQ